MATVAQLVTILSNRLCEPEHIVRQKLRQLQDDGLLPVARGRAVPQVDEAHIALAMFAVLASPTAKDATRIALLYAEMEPEGISRSIFPTRIWDKLAVRHPGNAGVFLATIIAHVIEIMRDGLAVGETLLPHSPHSQYEFVTNWPEVHARIVCDNGGETAEPWETRFHETGKLRGHWQGDVRRSVNVSGNALADIALDLIAAAAE